MPDPRELDGGRARDESALAGAPAPDGALTWSDDDGPDPDLLRVLRSLRPAAMPDDLAATHLARLAAVSAATAVSSGAVVVPLARRRGRTAAKSGAAAAVLAGVLAGGVGVAAAADARPGDTLYGLKTARERLQLAMARPGDARAGLELKFAKTRLDEAAQLLRRGDATRAVATLARADAALAAARAHGSDEIDRAAAVEVSRRVEVLNGLLAAGGLPDQAADAAREAITRAVERGAADPERSPSPKPTDTGKPSKTPPDKPGNPDPGRPSEKPADKPRPGRTERPNVGNSGTRGRG